MLDKIKIYKIDEINLENIIYQPSNDKSSIYIQYNNNSNITPLMIQLPNIYCVDGIENINDKYVTHELILPLICKTKNMTKNLKQFLTDLDDNVIKSSRNNKDEWGLSENSKYKILIKDIENTNEKIYTNGILKLKFIKSKYLTTRVFNQNREIVPEQKYIETFSKKCYIGSIIEIVSLWKKDDVFGIYIRPHQIKILEGPPPVIELEKYSFIDDSDDECPYDTEIVEFTKNRVENNSNTKYKIVNSDVINLDMNSSDQEIIVDTFSSELTE